MMLEQTLATPRAFFEIWNLKFLMSTADCPLPTAYCLLSSKEGALAASVDYQMEPIIPISYTLSAKVSASQRRGTYRVAGRSCRLVFLSARRGKT